MKSFVALAKIVVLAVFFTAPIFCRAGIQGMHYVSSASCVSVLSSVQASCEWHIAAAFFIFGLLFFLAGLFLFIRTHARNTECRTGKKKPSASLISGGKHFISEISREITDISNRIACEKANGEIISKAVEEPDFQKMLESLAQVLLERIDGDRIAFVKFDGQNEPRIYGQWRAKGIASLVDINLSQYLALWRSNLERMKRSEVVKIPDIKKFMCDNGIKYDNRYSPVSIIFSPVFMDGKLWATISVAFVHKRKKFSDVDETLMRSCASVIEMAEIRNRLNREIKKSEYEKT